MPSAEGNNNAASLNEYEQRRLANVERNQKRLTALKVCEAANDLAELGRPKKTIKKKRTSMAITDPPNLRPNLRPRPQKNYAQIGEEQVAAELHPVGDFLGNNKGSVDT